MTTNQKVSAGAVLLSLIVMTGASLWRGSQSESGNEKLSRPFIGEKVEDMGSAHVTRGTPRATYNSNPPTSGPHYGDGVAGPGIKTESVPDELVLHSMEHGAAVLWYRSDLKEVDVETLKQAFNGASGKKIMLARADLDVPVALTSWNYLLKLDTIDEVKIKEFIETNNDRAPEKAPI